MQRTHTRSVAAKLLRRHPLLSIAAATASICVVFSCVLLVRKPLLHSDSPLLMFSIRDRLYFFAADRISIAYETKYGRQDAPRYRHLYYSTDFQAAGFQVQIHRFLRSHEGRREAIPSRAGLSRSPRGFLPSYRSRSPHGGVASFGSRPKEGRGKARLSQMRVRSACHPRSLSRMWDGSTRCRFIIESASLPS